MNSTEKILILNVHKKDKKSMNDFADFNASMLLKNFSGGEVFYFSDHVNERGIGAAQKRIRELIETIGATTIFFAPNGDNYELPIEFFRDIKRSFGVKNILWVLDDELIFDIFSKYYAQVFDAAVTCDYYAAFGYMKLGVPAFYYFSSYSKDDFHPVHVPKDIDVSFIGDCAKADRAEYIDYLIANGVGVKTFGDGSESGFVRKEEIPLIFSRSKINLNFTKVNTLGPESWFLENNTLSGLVRQNKGRPMEIAMCNAFCLSEHTPSLNETFAVGAEMDVFHDKASLLEKVRHYLKNGDRRAEMAAKAYSRAVSVYEADVFFPGLVERLASTKRRKVLADEICKDEAFKKNHLIRLTIIMFFQLSRMNLKVAVETFSNMFQYGVILFLRGFLKGTVLSLRKAAGSRRAGRPRERTIKKIVPAGCQKHFRAAK